MCSEDYRSPAAVRAKQGDGVGCFNRTRIKQPRLRRVLLLFDGHIIQHYNRHAATCIRILEGQAIRLVLRLAPLDGRKRTNQKRSI